MRNSKRYAAVAWLVVLASMAPFLAQPSRAQQNKPAPLKLKVGEMAPNFTLPYFDGTGLKKVELSQYRGKRSVVLAFFVFAFTAG
jgi:cytochrome oxidase Cu insertion factor (SCO1/SenC/PrrC family)